MAPAVLSLGLLLLLLTCCGLSNAQGWGWLWGPSKKTTLPPPTTVASLEEQLTQTEETTLRVVTPEGAATPSSPLGNTTTLQKGRVWTIFTLKRPDFTPATTFSTAASPTQLGNREESIAGVGAEILKVAEGISNLVQRWDEKASEGTEKAETPATADLLKAPLILDTEPGSIQNTTSGSRVDGKTSLENQPPRHVLSVTPKPILLWNKTRLLLKKPGVPLAGSASFSFSANSPVSGTLLAFQETTEAGQEGATAVSATRAPWGPDSGKEGILYNADILELRTPQANSGHMPSGTPSKVVGALDHGLSRYYVTDAASKGDDRTHLHLKDHSFFKHSGRVVADTPKNHSGGSVSNWNATNFVDFSSANNSDSLEFLLTSTRQRFSHNSTGFPSFFPGLKPTAGHCLPLPTKLAYCNALGMKHFRVPNYLHQGNEEEVRAALHEWEGLLKSRCHRYLEWFFCLLLVPGCNASLPITPPPCRGFCEALKDLCWIHLKEGRLPIPCDSLPEENGVDSCVFVNVSAGNVAKGSISLIGAFLSPLCHQLS